jgi:hypothetical protein
MQMPFGKHTGKELEEIPTPYLQWILRGWRHLDPGLRRAMGRVLDERGCALPEAGPHGNGGPTPPNWAGLIRQWYRGLALDFHPDRGGSHEAMRAINEAYDRLRKLAGL